MAPEKSSKKAVLTKIKKRDGRIVPFDQERITTAIYKAGRATNEFDRTEAERISSLVVNLLKKIYHNGSIPTVEEVQDVVENALMQANHYETARAYILYREQHARIRDFQKMIDSDQMMEDYLSQTDWRVRENANMNYSLQGLNNYVAASVSAHYWLNRAYPPEIRKAHVEGDFHIHDLQSLSAYCSGWEIKDLLLLGFRGAPGKIESASPKHFRTALGQAVNFFYTIQGEVAGAIAFSNFDTYLAPFIRYDRLSYKGVKQAMQEFLFNINVPTRVGFQCLSEDTEILTPEGWKNYQEIKVGDKIKTFDLKAKTIENQKVTSVFKKKYQGELYCLRNRIQNQLISPGHRVVRKKFQTDQYVLEPIEKIIKLKSPFIIPIAGKNPQKKLNLSGNQIKLMAWIISEGTVERPGMNYRSCYRISIYQSKKRNKKNYEEIIGLLKYFGLKYSESSVASLGSEVQRIRLNAQSSKKIHQWFGSRENVHFIPDYLFKLDQEQSRLFLETYLKGDGFEGCKITTTDLNLLDQLQMMVVNCGYGFTVSQRKPTIGKKDLYVLRVIKHSETYISKIEKINYKGAIWCPHTKNETIVARRKGKVFITGNTPFTNITLDLIVPSNIVRENVIIGGKLQKEKYGQFQKEMDMFNRAFAECMVEGDARGRVFTFPIPTYNLSKDFNWNDPKYNVIFEMSAKYGIPYFANFINSDMKPEDARSMCCRLRLDNRELRKRGGGLFGANPLTGSVGVVTLNMARLGHLSKDKKDFFERLDRLMELAKNSLETKRKLLEKLTENGLYPYCKFYLGRIKAGFNHYWKNHFSTIGLIGMNEGALNLLGKTIADPEGREFAKEVLDYMRKRLGEFQEETGNLFNLEATPGEGTSYRLAKADKKMHPNIMVANELAYRRYKAAPYYTNSSQLPVSYTEDIFEALDLQDDLQIRYTGGTVLHGFLGERIEDVQTCKKLVKKIAENYHLPYFTLTPTFSICPEHGYISGEHFKCPKCKKEAEVFSRIVGYLRPVQAWNPGKQSEFKERKEYRV